MYDIENVFLHSEGGDVDVAMGIGWIIKDQGMNTIVAEDTYCSSACGYIFLAGTRRVLLGEVGMHELTRGTVPFHKMTANARGHKSITTIHWKVANYLGLIGVSYKFFEDSLKTNSDDMTFVGTDQLNKYIVHGYLIQPVKK